MAEDNSETVHCHCGKQFKRSATFRRHQEVAHSTSTSHKCAECGKTFGNANTLTMHMSVHVRREGAFPRLSRPATRGTRAALRSLQPGPARRGGAPSGGDPGAPSPAGHQGGASSAADRRGAAGIKDVAAGEGKSKWQQQQQATKHDIGSPCSSTTTITITTPTTAATNGSVLQQSVLESVRQTRAGARDAVSGGQSTTRRASPAAAATSATTKTPASAEDRDSRAETRARVAAAAEQAATAAAAAEAAAAAAEAAAGAGREGHAAVGVPTEQLSPSACQRRHQPQEREQLQQTQPQQLLQVQQVLQQLRGAEQDAAARRLSPRDEVCNDAAGSLSTEPPGAGRVVVAVADKADRSKAREEEVEVVVTVYVEEEKEQEQEKEQPRQGKQEEGSGDGGGLCVLVPSAETGNRQWVDATPSARLTDRADSGCGDAQSTQAAREAAARRHDGAGPQRAGEPGVKRVLSPVGSTRDDDDNGRRAKPGVAGSTNPKSAVSCGQGPVSLTPSGSPPPPPPSPPPPPPSGPNGSVAVDTDGANDESDDEDAADDDVDRPPALRKSCRDRKENPIWKTVLTGRMYEEVLNSVDSSCVSSASKRTRRADPATDHLAGGVYTNHPPQHQQKQQHNQHHQPQQLACGQGIAMIPTMVVKQEPMELGFSLDNIKQEMVEADEETGQLLPEMVALQYQRLKRGPVRRTRSGSMSGAGHLPRMSPAVTFDCLVCGKTFISEKYLSMHVSLHETTKMEPGVAGGEAQEALLPGGVVCPGQVSLLDDGEVYDPLSAIAVDPPSIATIVEQISTMSNNHFKSATPKRSPTTNSNTLITSTIPHTATNTIITTTTTPTNNSSTTPNNGSAATLTNGGGNNNNNNNNNNNKKATKLQTDGGWSCSLCNKTFAHNSGYKNHMRTHSNERPYVCHICDIGFKEKYHLKKHNLFIHSNELPEKCRVCGKRFKDSTAVRAHERIHSDERPFACRQCAKTFKTSECLWHHEHRSKTCGMALGDIIAQERLVRRRRRFPKSGGGVGGGGVGGGGDSGGGGGGGGGVQQQQSPPSPNSGSDTNPETTPLSMELEAHNGNGNGNENIPGCYQWSLQQQHHQQQHQQQHQQHMVPQHNQHHHQQQVHHHQQQQHHPHHQPPLQQQQQQHQQQQHHQHQQHQPPNNGMHQHLQHPALPHDAPKPAGADQYMPPVSHFFPAALGGSAPGLPKEGSSAAKHVLIAGQLQACVQSLHPEVTSALHQAPVPAAPHLQVPLCVEQHNMSSENPSDDGRLSPTNLTMAMAMKDLNCLTEIPHGMHPHEDEMMVAQAMYPVMSVTGIKQERDMFGYSMDEDEENWVTTNMDKIMAKEDDLIDGKVDAILSNMASSMSNAFGMLAGDPLPSPPLSNLADSKEFQCRMCRKLFADPVAYQRHAKVHSDERPFTCAKCDIGFKMKVHLKKHNLYVHSTEYPCECQYCGKKFKDSSAVKLHERTHSDSRPFGCAGCGKAFKTRENLWGHQHRGKCIAARKKMEADGCLLDEPTAKASVLNNGMSAHATVNTNGVTAHACVRNSQVTAHASIENNQLTARATFTNNQLTAHASVINNQVTAHASVSSADSISAQASATNTKLGGDESFAYTNGMAASGGGTAGCGGGGCGGSGGGGGGGGGLATGMTDSKCMAGSIPSTTATRLEGAAPPGAKNFMARSLMTPPPLNKPCIPPEGIALHPAQQHRQQQQNASPTAGSLPVTCTTSLPDAGCESTTAEVAAAAHAAPTSGGDKSACSKWPTLKEFLSKGIGPPTPVPTWVGPPPKVNGHVNSNNNNNNTNNNNNNNNGEYKPLAHDYPALKERLSRNFFSQLPAVVMVAPPAAPTPVTSGANNTSYPSSPASSNLSAPYSGQTTPTAGASPYGKGRDSASPYAGDYSPGSGGSIPSFQSTFLKRTNPPPLAFGNNPMLRGDDPNIPNIYWEDESDQRPPSSAWTSPESDTMFNDISESVFTQL